MGGLGTGELGLFVVTICNSEETRGGSEVEGYRRLLVRGIARWISTAIGFPGSM